MNWKQRISELVLLLCTALVSLYFLVPHFSRHIVMPDNTDNHLSMSIAVHVARALSTGNLADMYHFPIYYPLPYTLTAGVNMFGQGALIAPLWAIGVRNLPFLYNLLLLFALLMAGLGARRLFSAFGAPFAISLFGAALLVLHPFKQISYLHLNMIFFFPLIWGLAGLVRYLRQEEWRGLISMAAWLIIQSLFDLSLFFFSVIVFCGIWLTGVLMLSSHKIRALVDGTAAFLFSGLAVIALFWTYLKNPLNLQYGQGGFDMMTLIPGYYLFSAWHPLTTSRYELFNMPLFLGGVAFFMLAYFFWRPGPTSAQRLKWTWIWWSLFSLAVLIPFFLPLIGGFSGLTLLLIGDIGFVFLLLLIALAFFLFYSRFTVTERWLSVVLMIMGLVFFRAPYRVLPDALNPLNILSHLLPQLSRLRGYRLYYYVFFVLLLIAVLGFNRWLKGGGGNRKRSRLLVALLVLVWLFETVPSALATGPALNPRRSALFSMLDNTRADAGVLVLPHFYGDPYENIYLPHLFEAKRPFYNGCLGVGISDPLGLFQKEIFSGGSAAITRQIGSAQQLAELVQGRVLTLLVDRQMLWDWDSIPGGESGEAIRLEYWREWRALLAAFRAAARDGLLVGVESKPDGLVATIRDRIAGLEVHYRIGRHHVPTTCRFVRLNITGEPGTPLIAVFDDEAVLECAIDESGVSRFVWPYSAAGGDKPIRSIVIRADRYCEFADLEFN